MEEAEKAKLKELVEELESYRGRHTELITVYAAAGSNINQLANQLVSEQSTAQNIKGKATRTNVIDALEKIIRHLKLYKNIPENGLAIFSGNISKTEGQQDIKIWAIEPPQSLKIKFYRCDQTFFLEPLREMLEATVVFGLVVLDRKEATFGLLEGKSIKKLRHLTSGVPGKMKAGGQCLAKDSLIMIDNGDIVKLEQSHNPLKILSCDFNEQKTCLTNIKSKWENKKEIFKIITKYPRIVIGASSDHFFFVRSEKGIEEKPLSQLKEGDYLIMPEKINFNLENQKINFIPKIDRHDEMKRVTIPKKINKDFARLLGYYLGDGNYEKDRLTFSEQREDVAEYYKKLIEKIFGIKAKVNFREDKRYYQIRVYSRLISQLFREIFKLDKKTLNEKIPSIVLKSSDESLASFMAGFFDAEGYVSGYRIGLGINNETIVKQLQFSFLRLGIISSVWEYDNRRNPYSKKIRYTLAIDDTESVKKFVQYINFISKEKRKKLLQILSTRNNRSNVRQILINGKEIRDLFRKYNQTVYNFGLSGFFSNKRQLNKILFKKKLVDNVIIPELKKELLKYYTSELIPVKIKKIESLGNKDTIDIETSSHNFIANCLLVHNSAARFERLTEEMAKEFYRRIASNMKELFYNLPKLRGIILGGPGPTKEEFLQEGQLLTALKEKIIAIRDVGYTDEQGLEYLVESAQEILAKEEIIKEKKILENFFNKLGKEPGKVAYGLVKVKKALEMGAVDTLILSTQVDKKIKGELEELARRISSNVEYVSNETQEGVQFLNLSGIGAVLRFQIE